MLLCNVRNLIKYFHNTFRRVSKEQQTFSSKTMHNQHPPCHNRDITRCNGYGLIPTPVHNDDRDKCIDRYFCPKCLYRLYSDEKVSMAYFTTNRIPPNFFNNDSQQTTITSTSSGNSTDLHSDHSKAERCTRSRKVTTLSNPSASLLVSLSDHGFYIEIYNNSHQDPSTDTVHAFQRREVYVPAGCAILFHQYLVHNGSPSRLINDEISQDFRLFQYVVDNNGQKPTPNQTQPITFCESCQCCEDYLSTDSNIKQTIDESDIADAAQFTSVGNRIEGDFDEHGYVVFRSHSLRNTCFKYDSILNLCSNIKSDNIQKGDHPRHAVRAQFELS